MKIVATSDIHGVFPEIPPADLLLIGGDVCPVQGGHEPKRQRAWLRNTFGPWLESLPVGEIVWIAGNHDFVCETPGFWRIADRLPGHYLRDESVEIGSLKIYGFPWCPNLKYWAFYKGDSLWPEVADEIPDDTDILLIHAPIRGIGGVDGGHPEWAAPFLYERLTYICPKLIVCGHIHEGYGKRQFGNITVANVSHMDWSYNPVNPPMVFEIKKTRS